MDQAGFFFPLKIDTQMKSSWFLRCIKMDIVTISVEFTLNPWGTVSEDLVGW